jgi:hypothetical protein
VLAVVVVLSVHLFFVAHRPSAPGTKPAPEIGMTGWPIEKLSPKEEQANRQRASQALREAIAEQEAKVHALQGATSNASPADAAELAKQERILAAMGRIEEGSANKASLYDAKRAESESERRRD